MPKFGVTFLIFLLYLCMLYTSISFVLKFFFPLFNSLLVLKDCELLDIPSSNDSFLKPISISSTLLFPNVNPLFNLLKLRILHHYNYIFCLNPKKKQNHLHFFSNFHLYPNYHKQHHQIFFLLLFL